LLNPSEKPSVDLPKWNFRWRGCDTGSGEVVGGADETLCWLTFKGTGGAKTKGNFQTTYGDFKFKGVKVKLDSKMEVVKTVVREWRNLQYTY
jgi:hypothetical protein